MIHASFLGAGIATQLGTGVSENLDGLHGAPSPPQVLERRVDGRTEPIPYKLLRGFPLEPARRRLGDVVDTVVDEALREAGLLASERRRMA